MKVCKKCGRTLPDDAFYKGKNKCKECISAYYKEYYKKNYDPHYRHVQYEMNKEKAKAYYRANRKERIAYNAMYMRNKRATAAGAEGYLSQSEWNKVLELFDYKCAYCGSDGKPLGLSMDHILPLSAGGEHIFSNIIPCCRSCNSQKHTSSAAQWYPRQTFYDPDRYTKIFMHYIGDDNG